MRSFEENLDLYARLAIQVGLHLREGQRLSVSAPLQSVEYVRRLVREAYAAGAYDVHVDWRDDQVSLTRYEMAPDAALEDVPSWAVERFETLVAQRAAHLSVAAPTPNLFQGVDPARLAKATRANRQATRKASEERLAKTNWLIISPATRQWAAQVYPDEPGEEGVAHLWETIFHLCRLDLEDPIAAWRQHIDDLRRRADFLNRHAFRRLRYAGPGTDLTVELPARHHWQTAEMPDEAGTPYVANIPTEEAFTAPQRDGVNGTVRASMPLNYNGVTVENIRLELRHGEIVRYDADTGKEALRSIIESDEGSRRLGEIALVSQESPIARSGRLFYNTLYDENASCHIAIGAAVPFCIEGGTGMSDEQLLAEGANRSMTHVDFMIGSDELDVIGEGADGEEVPLLRKGRWAF